MVTISVIILKYIHINTLMIKKNAVMFPEHCFDWFIIGSGKGLVASVITQTNVVQALPMSLFHH